MTVENNYVRTLSKVLKPILIASAMIISLLCFWLLAPSGYIGAVDRMTLWVNSVQWKSKDPDLYYLELVTHMGNRETQYVGIVQHGERIGNNVLTVEQVFETAQRYCVDSDECVLEFDPIYHYPLFWGTSRHAMKVERFEVCKELITCPPE